MMRGGQLSYSERGRRRRRREEIWKWIGVLILVALAVLFSRWAFIGISQDAKKVDAVGSWLPDQELRKVMRRHGVDVAKVSDDDVKILRDGKWIVVKRRPMQEVNSGGE